MTMPYGFIFKSLLVLLIKFVVISSLYVLLGLNNILYGLMINHVALSNDIQVRIFGIETRLLFLFKL